MTDIGIKLVFLCLTILVVKGHETGFTDVVVLSDANFDEMIGTFENSLVMFYAPWCGYCQILAPEFGRAARDLKEMTDQVTLAMVDCTEPGRVTCRRFGVSGYPTVKFLKRGQVIEDYGGPRESQSIVQFMRGKVDMGGAENVDL